jgi:ribosomal protein L7/L12
MKKLTDEQRKRVETLLRQDKKVQAVKEVLHWHQAGLKAAKDIVDDIQRQMKAQGEL